VNGRFLIALPSITARRPSRSTRAARRWSMVAVASLAAHAMLLADLEWTWAARPARLGAPALRVRLLGPPPTLPAPRPIESPSEPATVRLAPRAEPRAAPTRLAVRARSARDAVDETRSAGTPGRDGAPLPLTPTAPESRDPMVDATSLPRLDSDRPRPADPLGSAAAEDPIPVYTTRFSPAASARYAVTRGSRTGEGTMTWSPAGDAYVLRFEAPDVGWVQSSEGSFDAAGLAPRRYLERLGRGPRATSFEPDAGSVRYSASGARRALVPGTQDRLGWLAQLGAVLAADAGRAMAGQRVSLPVAGVRGDASRWDFVVRDVEASSEEAGAPLLHLAREARSTHDVTIDVWLDPAAPALPLRVEWRTPLGGLVLAWRRLPAGP
jgi:hypothetical protein